MLYHVAEAMDLWEADEVVTHVRRITLSVYATAELYAHNIWLIKWYLGGCPPNLDADGQGKFD